VWQAIVVQGVHATADAIARLEDADIEAGIGERPQRRETSDSGPDDCDVDRDGPITVNHFWPSGRYERTVSIVSASDGFLSGR